MFGAIFEKCGKFEPPAAAGSTAAGGSNLPTTRLYFHVYFVAMIWDHTKHNASVTWGRYHSNIYDEAFKIKMGYVYKRALYTITQCRSSNYACVVILFRLKGLANLNRK